MRLLRAAAIFSFVCLAFGSSAKADCPPWRPCGGGNTWGGNRLVKQGFFGADFRPACANHDACLANGVPKSCCDQQFLNDMNAACECSSNPRACQRKARFYYNVTRVFGGLFQ